MIRVHDRNLEAARHVDEATHALVPETGAPETLPTDPKHLETMFVFCSNNWRTYTGDKPTGDKLARINAVYKQATFGDCTMSDTEQSELPSPFEKSVINIWRSYKDTPQLMAKRRFIALLRDVDVRLLRVKAYQTIPWGFPKTPKGDQICPYSNAKKGCPRPLMDKYGHNLEHELDNNESLSDFEKLKKWLDEVAPQQTCSLGLHTSITAHVGSRFATFFGRPECGGFQPYKPAGHHKMIKKVLTKQVWALVEMQNSPLNFSRIAQVQQRDRVLGLQMFYKSITGNEATNEVPCSRNSHHCNSRRLAEGGNHTHQVVIRAPTTDFSLYDTLIQVRRECTRLGVPPMTGPVHSIDHRCRLLQMKIIDFHRKKMLVYESQRRRQWRTDIAPQNAVILKRFSRRHLSDCLRDALISSDMDCLSMLVKAGADPTFELRGGVFPLMAAVLRRSAPGVRALLAAGADVDQSNSRGITALMSAVKRNDYAMVNTLLEEGAAIEIEGCSGWTAMSIAARHGRMDIAEFLVDTLRRDKISGEMNSERALNHRSTLNGGLTPVAIAAIHRNEAMVRCLMRLGARPGVKCHKGYAAGDHARKVGWKSLGLWLQETRAFGTSGLYTFADMQAESRLRAAAACMLGAVASGLMAEDESKTKSNEHHTVRETNISSGQQIIQVMASGIDSGHKSIQKPEMFDKCQIQLKQMRSNTLLTVKLLQEGLAAPDTETDAGHTALISAAYRGLTSGVRMLIQEGADPNYRNRNDRTALMAASAQGHIKVVVALLMEDAHAEIMDIDGKVAGAYANEKGYVELAELLAVAASSGRDAALNWERDRKRREEEENQTRTTKEVLKKAAGGEVDVPEADLHNWMTRVTMPRVARVADSKRATQKCATTANMPTGAGDLKRSQERNGRPPETVGEKTAGGGRCPKCTLLVPCLHFHSIESLMAEFPEGVPEWRWNTRKVDIGGKSRRKVVLATENDVADGGDVLGGSDSRSITWWKSLHQARTNRSLR